MARSEPTVTGSNPSAGLLLSAGCRQPQRARRRRQGPLRPGWERHIGAVGEVVGALRPSRPTLFLPP
jgi:hypothetical protein